MEAVEGQPRARVAPLAIAARSMDGVEARLVTV
jgi:hypothetical protein